MFMLCRWRNALSTASDIKAEASMCVMQPYDMLEDCYSLASDIAAERSKINCAFPRHMAAGKTLFGKW
jgi:hypothetical protein